MHHVRVRPGPLLTGRSGFHGIDLLRPVWHPQDLAPDGRQEWYPEVNYAKA